jgi:hypothetical protein
MSDFHGSYRADDCTFLLKPVTMAETDVAEKERLIQSGARHYSEMLSPEKSPDKRYMDLFYRALDLNQVRFARHIASLATTLSKRPGKEVVIASLARAGTPVGVLLHRALGRLGRQSKHYSVSIIRDRGIDAVALDYILSRHADSDVVFVDGWTGKGAITTELKSAVAEYNNSRRSNLDPSLIVVSDLAGVASLAATSEDYLIPSAILNSTVSGLVSRTVLNSDYVGPGDFHACIYFAEKQGEDLSRDFVERIDALVGTALSHGIAPAIWGADQRVDLKRVSDDFIAWALKAHDLTDRNRVKPGIGESTRALLRRVPDLLLVKNPDSEHVQHLLKLADQHSVPVELNRAMPYEATVVIKTLGE